MYIDDVMEQLSTYCDCLGEVEPKDIGKFASNVVQLISLVSIATNWKRGNDPCETFLMSERRELFDMQEITGCGCCDGYIVTLPMTYNQIAQDSIKVMYQVRDGIQLSTVELTNFSYDPYDNVLYLDFENEDAIKSCGCEKITKIIVTYDAGYERIPKCLLPMFCDLLQFIIAMNRCNCGCAVCDTQYEDTIENSSNSDEQESVYLIIRSQVLSIYRRQLESIALNVKSYSSWGKVL